MFKYIRLSDCRIIRAFFFLVVLFLNFVFILPHSSLAQDLPRFQGEEVVVTATRLPQPVSQTPWETTVITAKELAKYKTVGDALRNVAGVDAAAYGTLGSLNSIRLQGASASQVLILVDGRRVNSPTLGMVDMGDLLTDNVERVEIVRAPLSAIYGSDAISGVINIITKKSKDTETFVSAAVGSFGLQQLQCSIASQFYTLLIDSLKSAGFRRNGDYAATNVIGKINWTAALGEVAFDYTLYDANKGVPGVPTSEADPYSATEPNDRQTDKNTLLRASLKADNYSLAVYQNNYNQNLSPYIWGASSNQTLQTGLDWQQKIGATKIGTLLYGLEGREDKGNTTYSGEHKITNYALFLQDELRFGDRLNVIASIRGDKHSTAGTAYNPRVGVVYQSSDDILWRISAGSSFRAPTLNELYWNDGWMFGDPSLKPEKAMSYDIGLEKKFDEDTNARLHYFSSTVTDLILWDWRASTVEARAKNVGEAYFEGVEFELNRKLGKSGSGFVNYTYQKAVDRRDFDPLAEGKVISYSPQSKLNVGLNFGGAGVTVRYVGERYADLYNTYKLPSYTVVDLKFSEKITFLMCDFMVNNLFDEKYSEIVGNDPATRAARPYPMPGRSWQVGVKWVL